MYMKQKVVTRNFILDIVAGFQNFLGLNITSYEDMIAKAKEEIEEEMREEWVELDWCRFEITQLTNGALAVMLYGDRK